MFSRLAETNPQLLSQNTLTRLLFFIVLSLTAFGGFAQRPLTDSRQGSYYTYIYKLSDADLAKFYTGKDYVPDDAMLRHPVDSFKTGRYWENMLPPGNYLKVFANKNTLDYKLLENHNLSLKLPDNSSGRSFVLLDKNGQPVLTAIVTVNDHKVDANKAALYKRRLKKQSIVRAEYSGVVNYFIVKDDAYESDKPFKFPLKNIWLSINRLFKKTDNEYGYGYTKNYTGFFITNKPEYKPLDTVRFKAFILEKKSKKPIKTRHLLVRIAGYTGGGKTLATISSYRDGAFEYSFVLRDSLKLDLDKNYYINLVDTKEYKKSAGDARNGYDENGYKILSSGRFRYEEYELKSIHFNSRIDITEHYPGDKPAIYLKAVDENDLPVSDGRVNLTFTSNNNSNFEGYHLFIPDTLWTHKVKLDPIGETKVAIPDSIFPKADVSYTVNAEFLNAANERHDNYIYAKYKNSRYVIKTRLDNDTLKATYTRLGKETVAHGMITALNADDDTLSTTKATLPLAYKINPYATSYNIRTDSADEDIELEKLAPKLTLSAQRTNDSLFVDIDNPRSLGFWYTIYADGKKIDEGYQEKGPLTYKKNWNDPKVLTVQADYIWGGEMKTTSCSAAYRKDLLNVNVKQPVSVYPGQRAETVIAVTDADGKPVPGVDLTAWSVTRKFRDTYMPSLPYLGKAIHFTSLPRFSIQNSNDNASGTKKLNWARWGREMGLDSITYYQFTHTKSIFQREETGIDTITQVAPFIVKDGDIVPVHILYIDEKPVYFSQAQQLERYSFKVSPGKHSLRFRTLNQMFSVDSICVDPSKKLILSVNAAYLPFTKQPDTLTNYEAGLIDKYMITVNNNFAGKRALITQGNKTFFMNPDLNDHRNILVGPLSDNYAELDVKGETPRSFITEPGYSYLFEPGLLKQTSIKSKYPFDAKLLRGKSATDYTQYALTGAQADSIWQENIDQRNSEQELFPNRTEGGKESGRLNFDRKISETGHNIMIKNIIIYKYDDPDFALIYPGRTTIFNNLAEGKYRLFFLLKGDRYDIKENIEIKPYGVNNYRFAVNPMHARDSVSIKIGNIINARVNRFSYVLSDADDDADKIKAAFNDKYINAGILNNTVEGIVLGADDKQPVVGAGVRIKGTNIGKVTDVNGKFSITAPARGKLVVSYIGYITQEVNYASPEYKKITLKPTNMALQEVVVVGYQTQRKKDLTGAVSAVNINNALAGKVAGITVRSQSAAPGAGIEVRLRGASGFGNGKSPLYVVDGVILDNLDAININSINSVTVLNDASATALFGSSGSNGVIVISTKGLKNNIPGTAVLVATSDSSFRKNFSDYAYWQPKLTTDENGKATFTTVFPDDITNWRTFIIGVNGNRQSGFAESQIKSFKPLSAAFLAPQFAIEGDELSAIGKVTNYNAGAAKLTRTFTYNGKQIKQDVFDVTNSRIDTVNITATNTDSLTFDYTIKRDNGYFDGERRKIPVIKQGVQETQGIFGALNGDTTLTIKFDPAKGAVTFRAEASVLPALLVETERLRDYKYLCNEQLASKLKGLLMEKRVKKFLGEDFKYEKNINDVIKKLQENRKSAGTWGWWKDSDEELWISLHAVEALIDAQKAGYQIQLDKQRLIDYLIYQLESYKGDDKLTCLELLHKLDAKVDYAKYFGVIEKENAVLKDKLLPGLSAYDKEKLMLLKQQTGIAISMDSLLAAQKHTMFGNIYWGEDSYSFFDNSVQLTVLAYKIIKQEGKHNYLLPKIQGFFLEQRRTGDWRNTYESALIMETILPDVLVPGSQVKAPQLIIKGAVTENVNQFPYTTTLRDNVVSVSKTGTLPVYITGYQQFWNSKPEKVSKDFTVNTWFEKDAERLTRLKGGETVHLKAEVTAKGDADFVMIEIPIPAGCSYENKEQSWQNNEVHREYFKEKVSIFCRKLKQGKYEFTVNLLPRYSGKYTLNPANAEMMYFPVFYGREGMKKVVIGE